MSGERSTEGSVLSRASDCVHSISWQRVEGKTSKGIWNTKVLFAETMAKGAKGNGYYDLRPNLLQTESQGGQRTPATDGDRGGTVGERARDSRERN